MRTCAKCGKADNPLSPLRFAKSRVDGKVYCENCTPLKQSMDVPAVDLPTPSRSFKPSAGLVVIACPDCAGGVHRPKKKPCQGCAGYGAVRVEANILNVYHPAPVPLKQTEPQLLLED